ncbi:response regulator transcription factor [Actinomadura sp. 3N508]|uniref:response regulator transcription factor n=1 Tax=Actinomadura sp. 3N508 TaxID=3375153 RepID=UPI0037ABA905
MLSSVERMLDLAVAVLHERDPNELWPLITIELLRGCEADVLIHKTEAWSEDAGAVPTFTREGTPATRLDEPSQRILRRGYPFIGHPPATDRTPVSAFRLAGERGWRGSATAHVARGVLGADHVLGLPLPSPAAPIMGWLIYRSGADFTDDHLAYARRVQPLLSGIRQQAELLARWQTATGTTGPCPVGLTPRETTVLLLLAEALTADAIARRLGISTRTVHKHTENLYRKLGTRDRLSTVLQAQRHGLLPRAN